MRKKLLFIVVILLAILLAIFVFRQRATAPTVEQKNTSVPTQNTVVPGFDKKKYSTTDPNSIWVVVNKPVPLNPIDYAPNDLVYPSVPLRVPGNESMQLRKEAASALEAMFADAKKDGLNLMISSGYRSYTYQVGLYNGYVKSSGQAAADTYSARPGHSEHQTGLAVDIEPTTKKCEVDACFAATPEGVWLAQNAHKYGFLLRYTTEKENVTGYENEPWHYRYVGIDLSEELHTTDTKTLEEFFGVKGGTQFN